MSRLLAMPDDPAALPGWLDRQLVGPHLPRLVAELRVLHRPGPKPELGAVVGRHRAGFLEGGFATLPRPVLSQLLCNPDLLAELAPVVFAEGGDYWFSRPPDPALEGRAERVAGRVLDRVRNEPARPRARRRWLEYAAVSFATAAAVLLAINLVPPGITKAGPGWGFAKIHDLPRSGGPRAVYAKLADLADEWGGKHPADPPALAQRLIEFRHGCAALQLASDLPLSDDERRWVKLRCGDWAAEFDRHLRTLEQSGDTERVWAAASDTVRRISAELRGRAQLG
jgi:hypothetical protein